jgi:hypothetical protein
MPDFHIHIPYHLVIVITLIFDIFFLSTAVMFADGENVSALAYAPQPTFAKKNTSLQGFSLYITPQMVIPTLTPFPTEKPRSWQQSVTVSKPMMQSILAPEALNDLFTRHAQTYHVNPDVLRKIAKCESNFNPNAIGSGIYGGLFQFHPSTWISERRRQGWDTSTELRFNAEESIKTAAVKISRDGTGAWPICGRI